MRVLVTALTMAAAAGLSFAPAGPAALGATAGSDTAVTVDAPYVKANGAPVTPGDAIALCGANRRQQNEPSAAMDPTRPSTIVAGSNDYCTVPGAGGTWTGFYRSTDGGTSWVDSLLPGYPTDNSPEGKASPLQQAGIHNAGDPVQAWDTQGRVFYMGNAFNRAKPQYGSVWVATYDQHGGHYVRTRVVARGTSALRGKFNDKTSIEVDRSASAYSGNVYVAWSVFQGQGNNAILFARSTDHGATFSNPMKVSDGSPGNQFADIAVTSDGSVFVAWNGVAGHGSAGRDAALIVHSSDGGRSFTKPRVAADFAGFDAADSAGDPAEAAEAHDQAFENADGPESEVGEASAGDSRDCGSGPFACTSGYTFFRHDTQPHITADPTGDPRTVYLTYDAIVPGTTVASTSTYNTAPVAPDGTLQVGRGAIYFQRTTDGARTWSAATRISAVPRGHQLFPDINADGGRLFAVWHDSRNDMAYSVQRPPGNEASIDGAGFHTATPGLDTYGATSTNGGTSWSTTRLSATTQMPSYEMFGDRQVPFHGDYNYVTSVGGRAFGVWTDTRQVVPGDDPRHAGGTGFDVQQCRQRGADGTFGPDTCADAGGLDQDVFGAAITP